MAARRLLIILLLLLGISTLAAALVPPRALRDATSEQTTTQRTEPAPAPAQPAPLGHHFPVTIEIGGKRVPVVACSARQQKRGRCEPIRVGDRLTLTVLSRRPAGIEIPSFGLTGFAAPAAPAIFELLFRSAANYGIRFTDTGRVAARIQVLAAGAMPRARAGSGRG